MALFPDSRVCFNILLRSQVCLGEVAMRDALIGARRPLAGLLFVGMEAFASAAGSQTPARSQDVASPTPARDVGGLEHWRRIPESLPAPLAVDGGGPRVQVHTFYTTVSGSRRVEPSFTADEDAYVVVAHLDAYGRVQVVFPGSPRDDGFVRRGQSYRVPPFFAGFSSEYAARRRDVLPWRTTTSLHDSYDGGTAYLFVIASRRPLQVDSIADNAKWASYQLDETYIRDPRSAIQELAAVLADGGQAYTITYATSYASDRYNAYGGNAFDDGFDSFAYNGYSSGLCSSGFSGFGFRRFGFGFGRPYGGYSFGYGSPYYASPYYVGNSFFGNSFNSGFGNCGYGYPGTGFAFGWGYAPRAPFFLVPRGRGGLRWPLRPGPFGFPVGPFGVPSRRPAVTVAGAGAAGGPGLAKRYPGVDPVAPNDPRRRAAPAYSPADVRPPRAQAGQDLPTVFRNAPARPYSTPYAGIAPLEQPRHLEPQLIEPRIVEPRLEAAPRQIHGAYGPSAAAAPRTQPAPAHVMSSVHSAPSHAAGATSHGGGGGRHPH
jgi:hypothetical protein